MKFMPNGLTPVVMAFGPELGSPDARGPNLASERDETKSTA